MSGYSSVALQGSIRSSKGFRDFGIHFVQGYGLTECSPIVALNRDVDFKDDAAGLPLPGIEVRSTAPEATALEKSLSKVQTL